MNNSGLKTQPWGTPGVQDDGSRGFVPNSYYLGSISEEVQNSVAQFRVLMLIGPSFITKCWGMTVLKVELKSVKSIRT